MLLAKRDRDSADSKSEDRTAGKRQDRRARQRQRGHQHVNDKVAADGQHRSCFRECRQRVALPFQLRKRKILVEVEDKIGANCRCNDKYEKDSAKIVLQD